MLSLHSPRLLVFPLLLLCLLFQADHVSAQTPDKIDWNKARLLYQKDKRGDKLSPEDQAYLDRAKELRKQKGRPRNADTTGDNERTRSSLRGINISQKVCPVEKLVATTEDQQEIRVFYRKPPGDGPFPAVICIHGGVRKASDQTLRSLLTDNPVYTQLLVAGYVVVAGDFRTYGENPQSRGPILDCLAIVDEVKKLPAVNEESVVVFGGSGGGSIALELASSTKLAAIVCGEPATLLFCGMLGPGEFKQRFEVLKDPHQHYTAERKALTQQKIKTISCPVLILHGDIHSLKDLNQEIFLPELKAAAVEVQYNTYPGNSHGFYWAKGASKETVEKFMADTQAFLKTNLKTQPRAFDP